MNLEPEEWMTDKMKAVYCDVRDSLSEVRDLSTEDHYLMVSFASNYVHFCYATEQLSKGELLVKGHNGSKRRNPLTMSISGFQESWMKAAKDLGLGPTQRARLKFEKVKEAVDDPNNPYGL